MPTLCQFISSLCKRFCAGNRLNSRSKNAFTDKEHRLRVLEQAVEQSPVSIVITDAEGIIQYVNQAFEERTGFLSEEAIGHSPGILKAGTQPDSYYARLWKKISAGEVWSGQFHNRKKTGELFWEKATISPIRDSKGEIVNYVSVKEDITLQRQKDQEIKTAYAKVRAAEEAKTAFLNTMSHELRTPLNAIVGLSSVLKEESDDNYTRNSLTDIKRSGEQLLKLIEDLFELTQCYSETDEPFIQEVDTLEIVDDCIQSCVELAQTKEIELRSEIDPHLPAKLFCDPVRTKKALQQLLSNAVKFTEHGFAKLKVDYQMRSSGDSRIHFSIIDSGIGIASEDTERIFDPFFQVESDSSNFYQGAGVGLSICKHLVASMQSSIVVKSIPGLGSEFSFHIDMERDPNSPTVYSVFRDQILSNIKLCASLPSGSLRHGITHLASDCFFEVSLAQPGELKESIDQGAHAILIDAKYASPEDITIASSSQVPVLWIESSNPCSLRELVLATKEALHGRKPKGFNRPVETSNLLTFPTASAPKDGQAFRDFSILVVDDIPLNRKVAKTLLKHLKYDADLAEGGYDFLEKVSKNKYDLVLLDLLMPDIHGLEAFKKLKANPPAHGLPKVVALTANTQKETRDECLQAGMDGFITKPIDRVKIKRFIDSHFESPNLLNEADTSEELTPRASPMSKAAPIEADEENPTTETDGVIQLLDKQHIDEICFEMDKDSAVAVLKECYGSLARDFETQLREIEDACTRKDAEALIPVVHGLKGAVASLGWSRSTKLYEQSLEKLRAQTFADYQTFPNRLKEDFHTSSKAMKEYMETL